MSKKKLCAHCSGTGDSTKYCCLKAVGAEHLYREGRPASVKCCGCNGTGEQKTDAPWGW